MKKTLLIPFLLTIAILSACGNNLESSEPPVETVKKEEQKNSDTLTTESPTDEPANELSKETQPSSSEWNTSITELAANNLTTTEKADGAEKLARAYKSSSEELKEFEAYIVDEFKNSKYLSDITNSEYMLTNIFKSVVVERSYEDNEMNPIDKFAHDFYQNTKYTYRGADAVDSESVKSNEDQMNKALAEIK